MIFAVFANSRPIPARTTQPFARVLAAAALTAFLLARGAALEAASTTVDPAIQAASKSLEAKLKILDSDDTQPSASYPAVVITTYEANSYLKIHSGEFLPPGVGSPS